jgi:hypothetical protein
MNIRTIAVAALAVSVAAILCAGAAWAGLEEASAAYERGDYGTAIREYTQAAEHGHVGAQIAVGYMYETGRGVSQDYSKAAAWYRRAAEHGDEVAQVLLGRMYKEGLGVPQDDVRAYAWYNVAAAQSQTGEGIPGRDLIASRMTPSQLQEAQALSREYFEKYVVPFRKEE